MESIGDFAANLIAGEMDNIREGKEVSPRMDRATPKVEANQKDIRQVEVPDSFMQSILGESTEDPWVSNELSQIDLDPPAAEPEANIVTGEPVESSNLLTESQGESIISLLKEVKSMISEMTTTGSIGVNFAGPAASKPKPKKKSRKDVLKDSLRARMSK